MKKNFFKKLSFVMALAMIVSVIGPATGAFAATKTPKINVASKVLTIGQVKEYDFNVSNKIKGSKYAWSSSNKKVATVDKSGLTTAIAPGKATITVKVTATVKGKKKTYTSKATVTVKDNFKELTIGGTPKDDKVVVNDENTFSVTGTTYSGATTSSTAKLYWTVADKDGKETTDATITDAGVFKATKVGEYTVTVKAFQSADAHNKNKEATATADYKVNVINAIDGVKQIDATSFEVTFKAPVEKLEKADVAVSYLVATTPVTDLVKSVTLNDDKTKATVVMYNALKAGSTYEATVAGYDKQTFVAATSNVEDVDSIKISPETAVVGTATDITIKLFNKDGVDITTKDLLFRVTTSSNNERAYYDSTNKKLTLYKVGDTTTIEAEFHTYKYEGGNEVGTKKTSAVVTCVAAPTATYGNISDWSIEGSKPANFTNAKHQVAASDKNNLYVVFKKTTGSTEETIENSVANSGKFKYESTNDSVVIVDVVLGVPVVYGVREGSASIIVKYSEDNFATSSVVGVLPVNVGKEKAATTLKLSTNAFTLTNSTKVSDSKEVEIKVYDQYDNEMTVSGVSVTLNKTTLTSDLVDGTAALVPTNATKIKFLGSKGTTAFDAGTYYYTVKANGLTSTVVVTVNQPTNATVTSVKLNVDAAEYDVKLSSTVSSVTSKVKIYGYAANGVANDIIDLTTGGYTVKLFGADGKEVVGAVDTTASTTEGVITLAKSGATAVQFDKGVYTVKLLNANGVVVDSANFEVKNSSVAPKLTLNKITSDTATTLTAAVRDCIEVKDADGNVITNSITLNAADIIGTGNKVYVKYVYYKDAFGVTYKLDLFSNISLKAGSSYDGVTL